MKTAGDNIRRDLQLKVLNVIKNNHLTAQGDGVVVGVSGGPDSACLLHILHTLSDTLGLTLYAVHINHMLRSEESLGDEAYTAQLCKDLGIPLSVVRVNIAEMAEKSGMSLEEAGRAARYREFDTMARKVGAARIAVAHNRNDQAETVMMHIIRGSGTAGLAGMEYMRGMIIRPLLGASRREIEQYCEAVGLSPRTDSSNLKSDFTRNRIRLELFPYINKSFGVDMTDSLCRLSTIAAADNSFLNQCARDAYQSCRITPSAGKTGKKADQCGCVSLRLKQLRKLHPAMLGRVLKLAVCDVAGSSTGLGSVHYNAVAELVSKGITGTKAELPHGLRAGVSYGRLDIYIEDSDVISEKSGSVDFEAAVSIPGITYVPELQAILTTSVENVEKVDNYGRIGYNSLVQFFDYDSLKTGINIRNRRDGDIFRPFRSNGTKKLKEYFIDLKIPREIRNKIPLVCMDKEVVWVIGHKISDKFKVTENTKSVLKMEYNRRASL